MATKSEWNTRVASFFAAGTSANFFSSLYNVRDTLPTYCSTTSGTTRLIGPSIHSLIDNGKQSLTTSYANTYKQMHSKWGCLSKNISIKIRFHIIAAYDASAALSSQTRSAYSQIRGHGLWPVAIQLHVALVCRFLHRRNPCKYTHLKNLEGWKTDLA